MNAIDDLVKMCRDQTERYVRREEYDPYACFELWKRAVVGRDDLAWNALLEQYGSFVRKWIQHRLGSSVVLQVEEDVLLNGVFINVYRFLTPEKFGGFNSLPAVLQYLKLCCGSVVADYQRDLQGRKLDLPLEAVATADDPGGAAETNYVPNERIRANFELEQVVVDRVDRAKFWDSVWVKLEDPLDRKLVYLRYVLDLPPREIARLYSQDFASVQEVYRRIKNLLWRLRNTGFDLG